MRLLFILFAFLIGHTSQTGAQTWNEFRGPAVTGVAADAKPPIKIGPDHLAWKLLELAEGQSSMVIPGELLFTTTTGMGDYPIVPARGLEPKAEWLGAKFQKQMVRAKRHTFRNPESPYSGSTSRSPALKRFN